MTRYTDNQRKRVIEEWQRTGESLRNIAQRHGVKAGTAYLWAKGHGKRGKAAQKERPIAFAELVRSGPSSTPLVIEFQRVRVQVDPGCGGEHLRGLIAALEGAMRR